LYETFFLFIELREKKGQKKPRLLQICTIYYSACLPKIVNFVAVGLVKTFFTSFTCFGSSLAFFRDCKQDPKGHRFDSHSGQASPEYITPYSPEYITPTNTKNVIWH
jgi:hypothetical protein